MIPPSPSSPDIPERPVVGLGQASIDYLGVISDYPAPDSKCELASLSIQGGGPAATAMATLTRLGRPAAFIGAVGDDDFGRYIVESLIQEGVDVSNLVVVPGGTSQAAFIAVEPATGRRTIFWHRGRETDLSADRVNFEVIRRAAFFHTDGLKTAASLAAARTAREAGVPVMLDAGTLRDGYLDLAGLTDYLICSERFLEAFHPDPDPAAGLARLMELGPRQAVVTLGSRGSLGFDGKHVHRQPAYPVRAVDTTGAGDVYHGAYIHGILAGWDMAACMRFASAAAALKCEAVGGRTGIPDLNRIRTFMGHDFPGDEPKTGRSA